MPDNVFSSTMTLDGSQFLATNAKIAASTRASEAGLRQLDARLVLLLQSLRPIGDQAAKVQKQFEAVRVSTMGLTAATNPANAGLSITARSLADLADDRATAGMRQMAVALGTIAQRAEDAGVALEGTAGAAQGVGAAVDENEGQEKSEAEENETPEEERAGRGGFTSAAATAIGAHAGARELVKEDQKLERDMEHLDKTLSESKHRGKGRPHEEGKHEAKPAPAAVKSWHESPFPETKATIALEQMEQSLKKVDSQFEIFSQRAGAALTKVAQLFIPPSLRASTLAEETKKSGNEVEHLADAAKGAAGPVHALSERQKESAESAKKNSKELRDEAVGFRGLGEAASKAAEIIRDVAMAVPEVALLVGVLSGVGEAVSKIRETFEYGDKLNALSRQTGETATSIAALRRTFEYFDVSADSVGTTLFMLQRSLGGVSESGEPTAEAFGRIGLSIADLKKMDASQQFAAIQKGLQTLPDQATRSAVAMKIFGRSALEVQSILNASPADFAESMRGAQEYAEVMGKNADAFEEIERKFFVLSESIETIIARIAAGWIPAVQKLLDLANGIDFSKWGEGLTNVMGIITNAFSSGDIGKMFWLTFELGAADAMKTIAGILIGIAQAFNAAFEAIFSSGFWTSLAMGFKGVAEAFGAALLDNLKGPINALQSAIQFPIDQATAKSNVESDRKTDAGYSDEITKAEQRVNDIPKDVPDTDPQVINARRILADVLQKATQFRDKLIGDEQTANMSLSDYQRAHAKDSPTFYGKTQDDLQKSSDKDVSGASAALASIKSIADAFNNGFAKAQLPGGILDTSGIEKQLNDIIARNLPSSSPDSPRPVAPNIPTRPGFDYKMPEGDRLAKVGLFVGGSTATPGLSEARRTAVATEATARGVARIVNVSGGRPGQTAAVYQ